MSNHGKGAHRTRTTARPITKPATTPAAPTKSADSQVSKDKTKKKGISKTPRKKNYFKYIPNKVLWVQFLKKNLGGLLEAQKSKSWSSEFEEAISKSKGRKADEIVSESDAVKYLPLSLSTKSKATKFAPRKGDALSTGPIIVHKDKEGLWVDSEEALANWIVTKTIATTCDIGPFRAPRMEGPARNCISSASKIIRGNALKTSLRMAKFRKAETVTVLDVLCGILSSFGTPDKTGTSTVGYGIVSELRDSLVDLSENLEK